MKIGGFYIILLFFIACSDKKTAVQPDNSKDTIQAKNDTPDAREDPSLYLYSEKHFTDDSGLTVTIQNSLPKGGPYYGKNGTYGCGVFWSRFINESNKPVELNINFPADSFLVFNNPEAYLKLFLPTDTMFLNKVDEFNYGATTLQYFLDNNFYKPSAIVRIIPSNEDIIFYVTALSYKEGGVVRAGFEIADGQVFYSISISPHFENYKIDCGQLRVVN